MKYNIEPLGITGANRYGKTPTERSGVNLKGIQKDDIEKVFRSAPSSDGFHLTAELPIAFTAKVLRNLMPEREIVRLSSDGKNIDLFRDVQGLPGDVGVSCDPDGDEVPVRTLIIEFRDHYDSFTDRGLVWVYPGNPASISFIVKAEALKTPGAVAEIITASEEVVRTKILAHFQ